MLMPNAKLTHDEERRGRSRWNGRLTALLVIRSSVLFADSTLLRIIWHVIVGQWSSQGQLGTRMEIGNILLSLRSDQPPRIALTISEKTPQRDVVGGCETVRERFAAVIARCL
ncbi:MAG: hypothetical protein DME24_23765 [Verrucomicrobia bacterium]|nr:MAG: hypothetical protein DME24_23765 [Verrucomicrobiota bacterium]